MAGSDKAATFRRMRVEGSWVGENRLPGASRMLSSRAFSVNTLVSQPASTQRNRPAGVRGSTFMPSFSTCRTVRETPLNAQQPLALLGSRHQHLACRS